MVSFQQHQLTSSSSSLLPCIPPPANHQTSKTIKAHDLFDQNSNVSSSKKRKWETKEQHDQDDHHHHQENFNKLLIKKNNTHKANFFYDIEFELEKPLPLEWQRCLDIQSGQVHFYNTWTQKRTCKDPRQQQQQQQKKSPPDHHHHMSLELELNLPYDQSIETTTKVEDNWTNNKSLYERLSIERKPTKNSSFLDGFSSNTATTTTNSSSSSSSWISNLEVDDHREMVAAVCMRCHMLVMLCKATPSCPNCKFIYPPEQTPISPPNLCNKITKMPTSLTRLLCSKD